MNGGADGNVASLQGMYIYGPSFNIGTIGDFGFFSWLFDFPYWAINIPEIVYQGVPLIDRRDLPTLPIPQLPVGIQGIQQQPPEPGIELSNLVIAEQELEIPSSPSGEEMTPFYASPGSLTSAQVSELYDIGSEVIFTTDRDARAPPPQLLAGDDTVGVFDDLGDVFVDWVGQQVLDQPAPQQLVGTPPVGTAPPTISSQTMQAPGCGVGGASPVYKKVCGVYKWVYPKRRRRRALLTNGDYNDLLRIEGLKVNKNMTTAIAKALTR